ncbi:MAG: chemotaxis-specific protein-glutamate methyltransferase CheB [Coriobacteriales bacterium]|nr:chemotaxis-specific protein-glutamate methyltransferase CheB [Coriobacteriales bacterium]
MASGNGGPIRVLIVDDSLVAREMLAQILSTDSGIEVIGQARDGAEAAEMVANLKPDLVTMDIHMPRMDGLEATERIMAFTPTPILVVSSSVHGEGMGAAFDALKLGALEVIKKPEPRDWAELERIGREVIRSVKILANVKVITHIRGRRDQRETEGPVLSANGGRTIVAIGSSTGGPSALLDVLGRMPSDLPVPVVIAQHIAEGFIPGLVSWLDSGCQLKVVEATDGAQLQPATVYVAPTNANVVVEAQNLRLAPAPRGQLYVPSADALLESVAKSHRRRGVGAILTGMGADGAKGLKALHDAGGATIAQDEATCTVFGMPKAAIERDAVDAVLPVTAIGEAITALVRA